MLAEPAAHGQSIAALRRTRDTATVSAFPDHGPPVRLAGCESRPLRRPWSRTRRRLLSAAVALAIGGIAAVAAYRLGPKHLLTVEPGRLYRSAVLPPEQLADVVERYGIRTVVNLRSELENGKGDWYAAQKRLLAGLGVEQVDLPMDTGHPPSDAVLARWLELIDDAARAPILVHCEYGVIRTGMLVAVYEIEKRGLGREDALAGMRVFRPELEGPIASRVETFITGYEKRTR
jgi:protein tyrosine phosphatase (PTP) superfamily phosphohydrolase (DUF442 family)